jgi:hypothetical protein
MPREGARVDHQRTAQTGDGLHFPTHAPADEGRERHRHEGALACQRLPRSRAGSGVKQARDRPRSRLRPCGRGRRTGKGASSALEIAAPNGLRRLSMRETAAECRADDIRQAREVALDAGPVEQWQPRRDGMPVSRATSASAFGLPFGGGVIVARVRGSLSRSFVRAASLPLTFTELAKTK